ncbi:outer membrane receptor protein [Idiomarina sp. A28L]|uniref:TonB-dependent receptor n=1 Tax=Idiomarina sp. A28L TaxID=1036674 RepID=UPI0002138E62|nr:TonB-dependent receptor [Idiomarina sp. A28L]EGN76297.1 outer membrane receptor protein [Idiomarina sp. A28L]
MFKKAPLALAIAALLSPQIVVAQEAQSESERSAEQRKTEQSFERIIVTASALQRTALESAQPVHVLYGDSLRASEAATLGETLRGLPGVQATYYGPTSSSPIIRGLDGPRVKIVQNGLDVADISRGGPDHAVSAEATTAQQIEVLRGPSTLLFGSGASGGVVNVVDNRVPRQPVNGLEGSYGARYNSVSDERSGSFDLNTGQGAFALHLDGFYRKANDTRVPEFDSPDGHHEDKIENSFTDDKGATVGASYFFNRGFAGISFGRLERDYGIPGHGHAEDEHAEDEHAEDAHDEVGHEDEGVFARMKQDRIQFISGINNPFAGFESIDFNLGYTDLNHQEIEDTFVETGFNLEQTELRIIARHNPVAGWRGALGTQISRQEYSSFGAEAYTPATDTNTAGVFWIGERAFGDITWELGARVEQVELDSENFNTLDYTPLSASTGMNWKVSDGLKLSTSVSYSERAPSANELFANGAHFATRTFEVGGVYEVHHLDEHNEHESDTGNHDDHGHDEYAYELELAGFALAKERSMNIDFGMHFEGDKWHLDANLFLNKIHDFIYLDNLGFASELLDADLFHSDHEDQAHEEEHDHDFGELPVYQYAQQSAELYGYELSGRYVFNQTWSLNGFSDYTRAVFSSGGNVPRIPAQRFGLSGTYTQEKWDATIGYTYYFAQNRTAEDEAATDSFGLVNLQLNYYPGYFAGQDVAVYLKAENLTNELGYAHSSFIKNYAPLPGRGFSLGIRASF